ncbi:MFS family permease [Microbacterium halimionae]|uniref:MFS family permease n=1 Tax=Microbacterium halimionae TaxID=1526413 RepID=A0A7W3PKX4_9MICO|nr:MFS transporter [Microbacterium halimionae]MBA8815294.1 MFS family permease [Microbacterium halimionae]NII93915.1 MFS family permease [Microbacterium halimionae]
MARKPDGAHPATQNIQLTDPQKWRAFAVCVTVAAITILDLSKVNVALPSIESALGAGSTELQLIVSGYVLTFGLFLVPMGRIGDQRSRRGLFIIGLTVFTLASVACAMAPDTTTLLIARLIQGMAAGTQMPQVLGLIQQLFQGKERARAFGLFGATIGVATAFGPTIGGFLIAIGGATDGWRWIFWMNLPLGLIAIALAIWLLPATRGRSQRKLELDPVGVVLFGVTIVALMLPFLFTTGSPSDNPSRWWFLVIFVLFAGAFYAWERRYAGQGRVPLIPFGLFRISSYRNGTMLQAIYFSALPAMFLLTTLFLQGGLNIEPVFAGMVTIGFALTSAVASWVGGTLVTRYGRIVVVWGLAIVLLCVAALVVTALFSAPEVTPYMMAVALFFGGMGGGLVISPNQTLTLADIPVKQGGLAGSVGQLGQRIGTAVGSAIALALFYATIYRETDTAADIVVYHDAYGYGMIAVAVCIAIALVIAAIDLSSRSKKAAKKAGKKSAKTA